MKSGLQRLSRYKLTLLILLLLISLIVSFLMSKPPLTGSAELAQSETSRPWKIAYVDSSWAVSLPGTLEERMQMHEDIGFWAGSASIAYLPVSSGSKEAGVPAPRTFFPVRDHLSTPEEMAERFPHVPEDQLAGYGRTAYFVDYGEARFWFLDAARLAQEPSAQLEWLKRTAADNPQPHRIVLLASVPAQPALWIGLAGSGADLVLAGGRLYAPASAVTVRPRAGYNSSAHPGWAEWTISSPPWLLMVEGRGSRLEAAAVDRAGREADRLTLDAAGLRHSAAVQERAPVSIGAMWRYHPGGADVRAVIPPELDPTGEHPSTERYTLPPEDWRSPAYDDSGWTWSPAPFGRSQDSGRKRGIATLLPQQQSPTYYFRKTFVVEEEPGDLKDWTLHIAAEDGFIVYLNGMEIARDSIREGWVNDLVLAAPKEGGGYETFPLNKHTELLRKGENTLAVEVHGSHPDTPELRFDLSLSYKK